MSGFKIANFKSKTLQQIAYAADSQSEKPNKELDGAEWTIFAKEVVLRKKSLSKEDLSEATNIVKQQAEISEPTETRRYTLNEPPKDDRTILGKIGDAAKGAAAGFVSGVVSMPVSLFMSGSDKIEHAKTTFETINGYLSCFPGLNVITSTIDGAKYGYNKNPNDNGLGKTVVVEQIDYEKLALDILR